MSLKDKIAAQRKSIADSKAAFERSYRFQVGKTIFRVLPGIGDADDFSRPYGAHYIKDPRDPKGKPIAVVGDAEICYGKVCPVRQAISEVISRCGERGDETGAKHAKEWLAKDSYVVNMEILDGVDTENKGKVVRCELSRNQYDSVLSVADDFIKLDPNFSMKDGMIVQVERVGTGMNDTKYTFSYYPATPTVAAPTQSVLAQRMDLGSYVDGKFGMAVTKALTHLSTLLGRDVTQGAISATVDPTANAIAAPVAAAPAAEPEVIDAEFEALADIETTPAPAAVAPEPAPAPAAQPAPAPAAPVAAVSADQFDDILADLDAM